ncbi:MAG: ATP-grasp domain-containing protein [Minisyncoccia bacterium]
MSEEMKIKKVRIGILLCGMVPPFSCKNFELIYLVASGTVEEGWAKGFLKEDEIFLYDLNKGKERLAKHSVKDILKYSNIDKVVKKNKIKYLWFLDKEIDYIRNWNKNNDYRIIIVDPLFRKNLENKIWFDAFLIKHKLPKPESEVYDFSKPELKLEGELVVQKPKSSAGEGTFFIKDKNDLKQLINNNKISKKEKCLVRKKIKGKTYAITVFVSSRKIVLSAIRQMCASEKLDKNQRQYLGLQWMPSNNFTFHIMKEINRVFEKMGKILYRYGYFGLTSFDFMIDNSEKVYIIECNPRLTAATAQLIKFPELTSDLDISGIFINEFIKSDFHIDKYKIYSVPKTSFDGSILNIDFNHNILRKQLVIKKEYRNGVYELKNNKIIFKTPDTRKFNGKAKQFVYTSMVKVGEIYKHSETLAIITSNFRLYNAGGNINKEGKKILEVFKY